MADSATFPCLMVRKDARGTVSAAVERISRDDLPAGEVLIEVGYSSLNFKDALASQGHPGVVRTFPHVPGIDCAGTVIESASAKFPTGAQVLVTGYDLGAGHWGGFSQYVRVPAEWAVPLPSGLTLRESMVYGTAGFTAAQCVTAIVERGIAPEHGEVVVTGATGGVGCLAVAILAKLGYKVVAVTGKHEQHDWLRKIGAARCVDRNEVTDTSSQTMLAAKWAAAVDTVGGVALATIVRSLAYRGCVAACGLVGGTELPLSIYPFILRGVTLAGIDSAKCPRPQREEMWRKLAGPWRVDVLDFVGGTGIMLDQLPKKISEILSGQIVGRTVVHPRLPGVHPLYH
jgi:putative YhdH/YhfP family quinone oxidoreductase